MTIKTKTPHQRLKAARIAAGFDSASEAIEKCQWKNSTYRAHENGQNLFSLEQAKLYARAYKVSIEWLFEGKTQKSEPSEKSNNVSSFPTHRQFDPPASSQSSNFTPEFKGIIARGVFREKGNLVSSRLAPRRPLPVDADYPAELQFDLIVEDNSIYTFAQEGDYLRCLYLKNSIDEIQDGDLIVLERYINQDLYETTVRLLRRKPEDREFILLSLDGPEDTPIIYKV